MLETVFLSTIFLYYKTKSLHCNTSPFWKGGWGWGGGIYKILPTTIKSLGSEASFLIFYLNWGLEPEQPGCLYKKKCVQNINSKNNKKCKHEMWKDEIIDLISFKKF